MANIRKKFLYNDEPYAAAKKKLLEFLKNVRLGKADASSLLEFAKEVNAKKNEELPVLDLSNAEQLQIWTDNVEKEIADDKEKHSKAGRKKKEEVLVAPPSDQLTSIVEPVIDIPVIVEECPDGSPVV